MWLRSTSFRPARTRSAPTGVAGEVLDVRRARILLIGAAGVADAAFVVGEDDVSERGVDVDEQVVAVPVARLGCRGRSPAAGWPGRDRRGHLPDEPDSPPPRKVTRVRLIATRPPGAHAPAIEREDAALDGDRAPDRTPDAGTQVRSGSDRTGRFQLPEVAVPGVREEHSAARGDGQADHRAVGQAVCAIESEQALRLVRRLRRR